MRGRDAAVFARLAAALPCAVALAGCLHSEGSERRARPETPRSGPVVVEQTAAIDAAYVTGNRLYGLSASRPVTLSAAINTSLIATLSPAAVPFRGGRLLAYNSWHGRAPVVRVRDLETGNDRIIDEGALSVAWRRDGALAYFKALQPELASPKRYFGHVVVRRRPADPPARWTQRAGRHVVAAWAKRHLLAYRIRSSWPDLVALDGPGRARVLARASALLAVSPEGDRALVSRYGASPPVVRVLDVATGREVAKRAVGEVRWLSESGAWAGEVVAATASGGIAVFRVGGRSVKLEQVLRFGPVGFSVGPFEPRLEKSGRRIVGWAELESRPREALPRSALIACDRTTRRCNQAPPSSKGDLRLVYDPSRP